MSETMTQRKCDKCGDFCKPLVCKKHPEKSEGYCEKCHKSYPPMVLERE